MESPSSWCPQQGVEDHSLFQNEKVTKKQKHRFKDVSAFLCFINYLIRY